MKISTALLLAPIVAALPVTEFVDPDPELTAARANITEREPNLFERQHAVSLHDLWKSRGEVYFGVATDQNLLTTGKNAAIIQRNFGQVTPENSMKWDALQPNRGQFNWGRADYLVNWASQNGKMVRGHTLIWHSQLPQWVQNINNANTLREVIRTHVTTVVSRYRGRVQHWDVVNEMFNEDGTIRRSVFSNLLGEEFVRIAFQAARAADPSAALYINDYNLDRANYGKVNGMRYYVDKWIREGVPIDGIGTQTHLEAGAAGTVRGALDQLATAPVRELAITELDIAGASSNDYTTAVGACWAVAKCWGVTVWGVSDRDSWRQGKNPLLFDNNYNPKAAYQALINLLTR